MNQQTMLKALTHLSGSLEELFSQVQPEHLNWRPRENMRTLLELANHLAQIPSVDLKILQGGTEAEVRALEQALYRREPSAWIAVWKDGVDAVSRFYESLTPEAFAHDVARAFYGHAAPLSEWLLEIITHAYHHRAQLFTYLKILGYPVDMFTLYA
jgi:uncharacterized damage-inducible protein DinB